MAYTLPNANETATIEALGQYVNTTSNGAFGLWSLIALFGVIFINSLLVVGDAARAFLVSSFFVSIIAILLSLIGWLNPVFLYFFIILTAFGIMWVWLSSRN